MEENQNTSGILNKLGKSIEKNTKEGLKNEVNSKIKKRIIAIIIKVVVFVFIKVMLPIIIAFVVLSAIIKFLKVDDGSHKEGDYKNTDYVVSEKVTNKVSTSDITGNEASGYKLDIDLEAKVEEVLKTLEAAEANSDFDGDLTNVSMPGIGEGTKIGTYLSEENRKEYLKDFIKAELITQYPDLRNNPDAPLPEGELQGVIKIRRAMSDGSKKTLRYVDEETFNSYIDRYNRNGNTTAIDYFTLNSSGDLVVAKWNRTKTTLDVKNSGDSSPDTRNPSTNQEYNPGVQNTYVMTKVSINYRAMVEKYSMPFDFIWALLVMTEDEEFAHNLSKLALNSEIEFTVNDNKTTVETKEVYTYKKQTRTVTTVNTTVTAQIGGSNEVKNNSKQQRKDNSPFDYTITKTIVEEDTNPVIDLTSANTWIAKYKNIYVNEIEDERRETKDTIKKNDIDFKKTSEKILTKEANSQEEMLSDDFVKECLDAETEEMKNSKSSEILEKEIENLLNQKIAEKRDASIQSDIFYNVINQVRQNILTNINENKYSDELFRTWNISNRIDSYKGKLISERTAGITNEQTKNAIKESVNSIKNDDVINMMKEVINAVNSIDRDEAVNRNIQSEVKEVKYEYYRKTTNQEINTTITINSNKYIQGTPTIEEKLDKEATEENFVTLFNKSPKAINTLESTPDWVCEMLESSPKTADMVDLFKYIMYKASDKSYGVETFDFNEYVSYRFNTSGDAVIEYICSMENEPLWNYINGNGDYNVKYVSTHITQDKKYYKMMPDDGNTVDKNRNFGFGVCFYYTYKDENGNEVSTFNTENVKLFRDLVNVDITDPKYQEEGALLEVEKVDKVRDQIINNNKDTIRAEARARGITLDDAQIAALIDASYQYGPGIRSSFWDVYKSTGQDRKNTATRDSVKFFNDNLYSDRVASRWKAFSEGIYTTKSGRIITPSSVQGNEDVVKFALQFVGENHSRFTSYSGTRDNWCAMFVSYCYDKCGLIPEVLPRTYWGCGDGYKAFGEKGRAKRSGTYTPKAGDVIFFSNDNGATCYHTGIVTGCDGTTVYTVEGNTGSTNTSPYWMGSYVQQLSYSINNGNIWGYGVI